MDPFIKRVKLPVLLGLLTWVGACAPAAAPPRSTLAATASADPVQLTQLPAPQPIPSEEYAQRRSALAASMEDGVLIVLGSAPPELDFLPYAQNAAFRYLTGILEPDAALVLMKAGGRLDQLLFVQERDPSREVWEGARLGAEGATALTGLPAWTTDRFASMVDSLLAVHPTLYTLTAAAAADDEPLSREQQVVERIARTGGVTRIVPLTNALDLLRARKSALELDLIRRATQITVLAHREAMRSVEPGMNEFEMHALVEYYFRRNGAERPSFSSIVASGPNSTTLHYRSADRVMGAEELLLVDIGASYRGYAADVTRTYPVDGSFSDDQRAIYQIVLDAQRAAEGQVRAGGSWAEASAAANTVIATGLTRLGLIDAPNATYSCDSPRTSDECPQYRLYYMHSLGHGVGLEVHDPDVSYFGPFEVGSVFTLEPGIYVRDDVLSYLRDSPQNRAMIERLRPAVTRYAGIGVRIEDLYVVTATGFEWLSRGAPRDIDEIEALMTDTGLGQYERRREIVEWYPLTSPER